MISPQTYLLELRRKALASSNGWKLSSKQVHDDEFAEIREKAAFETLGIDFSVVNNEEIKEYLAKNKEGSFDELISFLAQSLKEDIDECTLRKYTSLINNTEITLLPISTVGAFCTQVNFSGGNSTWNLICIDQGLYFCTKMLGKSLVCETLKIQIPDWDKGGAHEYRCATKLFLKPNREDLNEIFFEDLPPELEGIISAHQSKASTMMLQFIGLHEFGHLVHNDLQLLGLYKLHMNKIWTGKKFDFNDSEQEKHWDAEYEADIFALKALCSRSKSDLSVWANFITIYFFFTWLNDIEKVTDEIISPLHPPPKSRAENLREYMYAHYVENMEAEEMFTLIQANSDQWLDGIKRYLIHHSIL